MEMMEIDVLDRFKKGVKDSIVNDKIYETRAHFYIVAGEIKDA